MINDIIQKASIDDCGEISVILSNDLGYPCSAELVKKKMSAIDPDREAVFKAVWDGQIVGVVHVEKYDTLYFETLANILGIAVKKEYRRQGIGSALMVAAETWAEQAGAEGVRLNSGGLRSDSHEFYRSIGYAFEKTQIRFMKKLKREYIK